MVAGFEKGVVIPVCRLSGVPPQRNAAQAKTSLEVIRYLYKHINLFQLPYPINKKERADKQHAQACHRRNYLFVLVSM